MSNLADFGDVPVIEVWGEAIRARRVDGERITLALVELAPDAIVPGHQHEAEQLGMVVEGRLSFTVGSERRELRPSGTWPIPSNIPHQVTAGPQGGRPSSTCSRRPAPTGMACRQLRLNSRWVGRLAAE